LNLVKTKITHSTEESAKFLGYTVHETDPRRKPRKYVVHKEKRRLRLLNPRPRLDAPIGDIVRRLIEKGYARKNGNPTRCGRLIHLSPPDIVRHYLAMERGLLGYYGLATNYGSLSARVHYILKYSCALTLCAKLRLRTLKKTYRKFGKHLTILKDDGELDISFPTRVGHYAKPK